MKPQTPTDAAELARYVFIEKARCPVCDSADLQTIRSEDQGDGSVKRRTVCRDCSHKFFVVAE